MDFVIHCADNKTHPPKENPQRTNDEMKFPQNCIQFFSGLLCKWLFDVKLEGKTFSNISFLFSRDQEFQTNQNGHFHFLLKFHVGCISVTVCPAFKSHTISLTEIHGDGDGGGGDDDDGEDSDDNDLKS